MKCINPSIAVFIFSASVIFFEGYDAVAGLIHEDGVIRPFEANLAPVLDGRIDDRIWQNSAIEETFITYNPTRGDVLPQKTVVWMAYDSESLYFAFKCYDTDPEKIKTSITQRDHMFADDWVGLSLDALGNQQSSYDLFVNPDGIQGDILTSAVSGEDISPDFVWESAGCVTEEGYEVEMKIPLRSIRFKSGKEVRMGILFWRRISRLGTSGSWPEIVPGRSVFSVHAPVVYENLKRPLMLEVLPSFTYGSQNDRETTQNWGDGEDTKEFGAGLKYGITSSVIADVTYNPDFSQIESDAFQAEVNRRYPIFYNEKRPFFMEGTDIFDFSIIDHGMMLTAVHTRQIVDPLWGGKLTGTVGKLSFGVLSAGDEFPGYAWDDGKNPNENKKATFLVGRAKYGLGGDNYAGAIYSGRSFVGDDNHVVGGDISFRFWGNHRGTLSILNSLSSDDDGERNGLGVNADYAYNSRSFGFAMAYEHYDSDFEMASAFLMRTGIDRGWIFLGPNFYPNPEKWFWLRRISPGLVYAHVYDHVTEMHDSYLNVHLNINFTKQGYFYGEIAYDRESWEGRMFDKWNLNASGGIQLTNWLRLGGDMGLYEGIYYWGDPAYLGYAYSASGYFTFQPNVKVSQSFDIYHQTFNRSSDHEHIYDIQIINSRTTYQFNKYFFVRAILQYDSYEERLLTDFLASFTFIPGTVLHLGYGSIFERRKWHQDQWILGSGKLTEARRGLFFKASYLWRI